MLVERGLKVMNVEAVGEAYAIASNYLRKSGVIADTLATNERLLGIIVNEKTSAGGGAAVGRITSKLRASIAATNLISSIARWRPGHTRGPPPNGKKACGSCPALAWWPPLSQR